MCHTTQHFTLQVSGPAMANKKRKKPEGYQISEPDADPDTHKKRGRPRNDTPTGKWFWQFISCQANIIAGQPEADAIDITKTKTKTKTLKTSAKAKAAASSSLQAEGLQS